MKGASIMISTKYKDGDNNHHDGNNHASELCSTVFLRSPGRSHSRSRYLRGGGSKGEVVVSRFYS